MDILIRRIVCVILCLVLHGCASVETAGSRRYLDSVTAATITVSSQPWVFARERPDVAANLRDYLTLYWVEVNRSGERRIYLVAHAWSTVSPRIKPTANGARLDIAADDRSFSLQPLTAEPRSFGIGEPIASARGRTERISYYPIDPEALEYLATARTISVTLSGDGLNAQYRIWRAPDLNERVTGAATRAIYPDSSTTCRTQGGRVERTRIS